MIKNIKSELSNMKLFSLIDERKKLKIVKYNQKKKKFEKYVKYGINRIGKEYNARKDELIFKGEYLNGQRNGYGKEYFPN